MSIYSINIYTYKFLINCWQYPSKELREMKPQKSKIDIIFLFQFNILKMIITDYTRLFNSI